jgi:ribonuclease PH
MNVVMLRPIGGGDAKFVEVQGTAEGMAFTRAELDSLLVLAEGAMTSIAELQAATIATPPPARPVS